MERFLELLDDICYCALIFAMFFCFFTYEIGMVSGSSMAPNIKDGYIVIEKWRKYIEDNRGIEFYDIVSLSDIDIEGETTNIVKRVIGLPGDYIEIKNGTVYRNGVEIDETIIVHKDDTDLTIKVSEGHIFVLGDNRLNSLDSRKLGEIPLEKVYGVVKCNFDLEWFTELFKRFKKDAEGIL